MNNDNLDSIRYRVMNILKDERKKELMETGSINEPVFRSKNYLLQKLDERSGDNEYIDLRGSFTKAMNRHTPFGQHKGDNFPAKDIFWQEEFDGEIYYCLLIDLNLGKFDAYTASWRRQNFNSVKHTIKADIIKPKNDVEFTVNNVNNLERITLFENENGTKCFDRRDVKQGEVMCYFARSKSAFKIGKTKDPRSRIKDHRSRMQIDDFVLFPQNEIDSERKIKQRFRKYRHPAYNSQEMFKKNDDTRSFYRSKKRRVVEVVEALETDEIDIQMDIGLNTNSKKFFEF